MMKAMQLQASQHNGIMYEVKSLAPNPVYKMTLEATNVDELNKIANNEYAMAVQALLVRERILGPYHNETIYSILYCGAINAEEQK